MKTTGSIGRFVSVRGLAMGCIAWIMLAASWTTAATEYFVRPNGDDGADGTSWATALASPQVALNLATNAGDIVTVTNGVYELDRDGAGATVLVLAMDVDRGITMRSVNGPEVTILDGGVNSSARIALLQITHEDALVEGFTLQGGAGRHEGDIIGLDMSAGTIRDCIIRRCSRYSADGAIVRLTGTAVGERLIIHENAKGRHGEVVLVNGANAVLRNSLITDNFVGRRHEQQREIAYSAGPALRLRNGTVEHCTIAGNYAGAGWLPTGLILEGGTVRNSIIYHNRDRALPVSDVFHDQNVVQLGGTIEHSVMTPLLPGAGNRDGDPQFARRATGSWSWSGDGTSPDIPVGDYRLGPGSPAINAGADLGVAVDLAGNPRASSTPTPDSGAYEALAPDAGSLRVSFGITNAVSVEAGTADFKAQVAGADTGGLSFDWDFGNGMTADAGDEHTGIPYNAPGVYTVRVEIANASNETAAWSNVVYRAPAIVHVAPAGQSSPAFPFATPETAVTSIQQAIAAAAVTTATTSSIQVAEGLYLLPSQQTIQHHKPIAIQGAGPGQSIVDGQENVRVLEMWHPDAVFAGFTITNGFSWLPNSQAGGVYMTAGTLRDCHVVDNQAGYQPGGAVYISGGLIDRCVITDSTGQRHGAGVAVVGVGILRNSLIARNDSTDAGTTQGSGGVYIGSNARMENCTVVDNLRGNSTHANNAGGLFVISGGQVVNSIVWYNRRHDDTDDNIDGTLTGVTYTAAPELDHDPDGTGNLSDIPDPGFVDRPVGNYRLVEASPCVNAGTTDGLAWMVPGALDLAGNPRLVGGRPELGAYEFIPPRGTLILFR